MPERRTAYRIDFSIQRREENDEDYTEIGFGGSTGQWSIDAALYAVESIIQRREWESSEGMPDPEEVKP